MRINITLVKYKLNLDASLKTYKLAIRSFIIQEESQIRFVATSVKRKKV